MSWTSKIILLGQIVRAKQRHSKRLPLKIKLKDTILQMLTALCSTCKCMQTKNFSKFIYCETIAQGMKFRNCRLYVCKPSFLYRNILYINSTHKPAIYLQFTALFFFGCATCAKVMVFKMTITQLRTLYPLCSDIGIWFYRKHKSRFTFNFSLVLL